MHKKIVTTCAASIQGRVLFKGGFYSRAGSIQGRVLFKGGFYSRAGYIQGRVLFKGGFYSRAGSIQVYHHNISSDIFVLFHNIRYVTYITHNRLITKCLHIFIAYKLVKVTVIYMATLNQYIMYCFPGL